MIEQGNPMKAARQTSSLYRIVSFYISTKEYAIEINFIKEIIYSRSIIPLPDTSNFIEGIIDLRGIVVPVVNLKKRLQAAAGESSASDHILIVEVGQRKFGLMVDRVLGVLALEEQRIQAPQDFMDRQVACLRGVCQFEGRLILLLDLERLWNDLDLNKMQSATTLDLSPKE